MKKLFSILVLALSFSALSAQQTTVALLNHEGTISTFYGSEALVQAHKAAVHGDAITLSGGSFNAPSSWTKAVTLRGAGCYEGADNSREVTYINKTLDLAIPAEVETAVILEGVNFKSQVRFSSAKNTTFLKCYFTDYVSYVQGNTNFYNCIMIKEISFAGVVSANINLFNCYVTDPCNQYTNYDWASSKFTNCVIRNSAKSAYDDMAISKLHEAKYHNCIFIGNMNNASRRNPNEFNIPVNSTANNCLSCCCVYIPAVETDVETIDAEYDYNVFENISAETNKYLDGKPVEEAIKSVFKTYNGTNDFSFNELYELTDEAKTKYLGSDGTQVGLYGGMGFDLVPSTLQITKCEVAPRSTKDGKLSVKIEVGIPE